MACATASCSSNCRGPGRCEGGAAPVPRAGLLPSLNKRVQLRQPAAEVLLQIWPHRAAYGDRQHCACAGLPTDTALPLSARDAGQPSSDGGSGLIEWLVAEHGATPLQPPLAVVAQRGGRGRALSAARDIAAGEVLLSVPMTAALSNDQGGDPDRWVVQLALRLLRLRREAAADDGSWRPWLQALPHATVPLPWLVWSDAQLEELQDPSTLQEAVALRQLHEDMLEEVAEQLEVEGYGRADFEWAVSLLHSRCFVTGEPPTRLTVPGIDMANHAGVQANAAVRFAASPGMSQGLEALAEVADVSNTRPSPNRFELVAGPANIRRGEEVCISYGSWPNDVLLLYFGFVPEGPTPHDSVVLFHDLADMADCWDQAVGGKARRPTAVSGGAAGARDLSLQLGEGDWTRLVVTAEGFDARVLQAGDALLQLHKRQAPQQERDGPSVLAFLLKRCQQLLNSYPTSLADDEACLEGLSGDEDTAWLRMALAYRLGKKRVLANAIASIAAD